MNKKVLLGLAAGTLAMGGLLLGKRLDTTRVEDLNPEETKKLVESYDQSSLTKTETVFIDSQKLTVVNQKNKTKEYTLPKDEFFVSIAPYYQMTHPCSIHYLSSCYSELGNQPFEVVIKNKQGEILVDETLVSQENGFIDLWVPRNQEYTIQITHNGSQVETTFSTFNQDDTCITTPLQLT